MLAVLHQRNFGLLWIAGLISGAGTTILFIALPFYIYEQTGSALATGAMFIVQTMPRLLLGSLAGVFVDRWDRKRTMVIADLSRAALILLLLAARSPAWLWVVYVVAFAESAISLFFGPAANALLPRLVAEQNLVAANALNAQSNALTMLVGPMIGGAFMGLLGLSSVVLVDAASYAISGLLIALIRMPDALTEESVESTLGSSIATWGTIWREWIDGLRLLKRERFIAALFMVTGCLMVAQGIINVLWVPFVKDVLRVGAVELGWLGTAAGVGGLLGGYGIGKLSNRVPPTRLIVVGAWAVGMIFLVRTNVPFLPLTLALNVLLYMSVMSVGVGEQTLLQSHVADQYRGRVFGALSTTEALLILSGMGLAGVLGDIFGVVPLLNVAGILWLVAGVVALTFLPRAPKHVSPVG